MIKYLTAAIFVLLLGFPFSNAGAQKSLPFGNITLEELSDKPYKPDPSADAVILSEIGVASLQYFEFFYVEYELDVRIKIVSSDGYDYANIEIPFFEGDYMDSYKASTFNLRNGEKIETKVPKESFVRERTTSIYNTLKFSFPDVHEGSVLEYQVKMRQRVNALFNLIPWDFQDVIPVKKSVLTVVYPDAFVYKTIISGSSDQVLSDLSSRNAMFLDRSITQMVNTYAASNQPAFKPEPYILSQKEHLTSITFELSRVDFPNISFDNISPTYQKLNQKLYDREDFGSAMATNLRSQADEAMAGAKDDMDKIRKIHAWVANNVFWNGEKDFTSSTGLRAVLRKGRGNSADVNLVLIAMLKSAGFDVVPVILSTRSNGRMNEYSAMLQQFDYIVASLTLNGKVWLIDATDPLRPFDMLPFECLNSPGRLIDLYASAFVDMKNDEKTSETYNYDLKLSSDGSLVGQLEKTSRSYSAYNIRKTVRLESEEGFFDIIRSANPEFELSDFRITGLKDPYSDITTSLTMKQANAAQLTPDRMIITALTSINDSKSPFYSLERKYPVDMGCPSDYTTTARLEIPDGYTVLEKPADAVIEIAGGGGSFGFSCTVEGKIITVRKTFSLSKTRFQVSEYNALREFYDKMLRKQAELIILKKNPVSK